ncbi:hypothetical protein [Gordonia sp. ABSL49_1]|uniref:hypothetical protein n=1 Tax=Gordonia sp. ABSL49_1 TaxID=2920941 RepID=UPI001F0FB80B|nr:hypothetical protein [Gordonia sp. ABSL49_1]MCH5645722.1 hypothetical protein [Gordonia sp. ABSL49_1]
MAQPTDVLEAAVKQYLSELTDDDFAKLVAEVRPPADDDKPAEQKPKPKDDGPAYPASWGFGDKK